MEPLTALLVYVALLLPAFNPQPPSHVVAKVTATTRLHVEIAKTVSGASPALNP